MRWSVTAIFFFFLFSLLPGMSLLGQDTLLHSGAYWQYLDDGSDPGPGWTELHYEDDHWKEGPTPLGYGYDDLATVIAYGYTSAEERTVEKFITSYFKKNISIDDVDAYMAYKINYRRDDGAIIYINNVEIARSNMPGGAIHYKTLSKEIIKGREEHLILSKYLEPEILKTGINTIAVEVHQRVAKSTDIILDFELIGIENAKRLHQFLSEDQGKANNPKLELLDLKHELNEEIIRNDFSNRIIRAQWLIIALGVLVLICAGVLFYKYYLQQIKDKENLREEKKDLENRIKNKDQESINLSVASIRNKNFFKEFKLELLQLSAMHSNAKNDLSKLINRVDVQSQNEEDWQRIKIHLDSIYSGFFERLNQKYPTLSQQELKHCGFIKLRFDTKEISQILRVDPKSVQTARYRIKKKMKIREAEDLRTVICSL